MSIEDLRKSLKKMKHEERKHNVPEYVRLDVEPAEAGKSLLRTEIGTPKAKRSVLAAEPEPVNDMPVRVSPFKENKTVSGITKRMLPSVGYRPQAWDVAGDPTFTMDREIIPPNQEEEDGVEEYSSTPNFKTLTEEHLLDIRAYFVSLPKNKAMSFVREFEQTYGAGSFKEFIDYTDPTETEPEEETEDFPPFFANNDKKYFVFVYDSLVTSVETFFDVESAINTLLKKDVKLEDINVFQRLELSFGVKIKSL